MKITLNTCKLNDISLSYLIEKQPPHDRYHINQPVGQEFYKLYAFISSLYNGIKIADIGSRTGNSALALSHNEANEVHSYDIDPNSIKIFENIKKPNVKFSCEDVLSDPKLLECQIISLDVDPHDGQKEKRCLEFLAANSWKGLLLLDDIGPDWLELHRFWNDIQLPKYDLTKYGHASGTGLVDFTGELELVLS